MFDPSALECASCESLVNHQDSIPIRLHRNSEVCARRRNSSLEITTVDALTEWHPRRELRKIPYARGIYQALHELDPSSLFVDRALKYGCFLEVASSNHLLNFPLTLDFQSLAGSDQQNACVLDTFSGSLVESLIVSVRDSSLIFNFYV